MADRVYIMKEGNIFKEINDRAVIAQSNALEAYL
jgi:ABC-type branched-subunit amino acid transport system ATPase component